MAKKSSKKSKTSSKQSSEPGEVAWIVTRLTGTPARYVGRVFAANEEDAIKRAIKEFRIRNSEMQKKLSARRET